MLKTLAVLAALGFWATLADCQRPALPGIADSSIHQILMLATRHEELGAALRPSGRPSSPAKLDSLADRITERAIQAARHPGPGSDGFEEVLALKVAGGRPNPGRDGSPYAGAASRLIRIHKEAPESAAATRGMALLALADVVGFHRNATYLRIVATSRDVTAGQAMAALISVATPEAIPDVPASDRQEAVRILEDLWRLHGAVATDSLHTMDRKALQNAIDAVPDLAASTALFQFAVKQGWAKRRR